MRDNVLTPAFYEIVSDFEKRFREAAPDDHRYDCWFLHAFMASYKQDIF